MKVLKLFFFFLGISTILMPQKGLCVPFDNKTFEIYVLSFGKKGEIERGFVSYLSSRGLKIKYIFRSCNGLLTVDSLKEYVKEIKELKPDLVFTWGSPITEGIAGKMGDVDPKKHITTIPIVAMPIGEPVSAGFAPALNTYTGRKLAGVTQMIPTIEQIQVVKGFIKFKKLGVIYSPFEPNIVGYVEELKKISEKFGEFEVVAYPLPLRSPYKIDGSAIPGLFEKLVKEGVDLLYEGPDSAILEFSSLLMEQIRKYRIPSFATSEGTVLALKPLVGFFCKFYDVGRLGGRIAEKILLKLRPPEELYQFERLKRMSYVIDITKALELEIYPPINSLKFAEIIEE